MSCINAITFHRKSGVAKWRDLLFIIRIIESGWKRYPPLCHPDRSVAKWRDLQFRGPLLEMFSTDRTGVERTAIYGWPSVDTKRNFTWLSSE
jgi:hypothetical protein